MPSTIKHFFKTKWPIFSVSMSLGALLVVATSSLQQAPLATSEREMTLSSLSKPGMAFAVLASPTIIRTSATPVVLTTTIRSAHTADHVTVTWSLPAGVTLASGSLTSVIDHLDAAQPVMASISVTVDNGALKPILVNASYARGSVSLGNGATISVNQSKVVEKRARFQATGDQRIFE